MKWVIRIYSVVLLAYTGWRTYDFMSSQLPKSDISFWLSIAFLFATEAGLVLWHEAHLHHTTTETQDKLTFALTWIDFVGSLAAGIADMILRQTFIEGYAIPPMLAQFLLYGLPSIMAINVAGVILFEQNDAEVQQSAAENAARFEVHRQAMKQIRSDRQALATEKSGVIYDRMRGNVTGRVDRVYGNAAQEYQSTASNSAAGYSSQDTLTPGAEVAWVGAGDPPAYVMKPGAVVEAMDSEHNGVKRVWRPGTTPNHGPHVTRSAAAQRKYAEQEAERVKAENARRRSANPRLQRGSGNPTDPGNRAKG